VANNDFVPVLLNIPSIPWNHISAYQSQTYNPKKILIKKAGRATDVSSFVSIGA
jgi:hypothetical protein